MFAARRAWWNDNAFLRLNVLFNEVTLVVVRNAAIYGLFIKFDLNDFRNTAFFHGYTKHAACAHNGLLVMRNDNVLAHVCECAQCLHETHNVLVVECCINFVEQTEWARTYLVCCEQKCNGGHGLFTTREQGDVLQLLSRRLCVNINTGRQYICRIEQTELGASTVEQAAEHVVEVASNLVVCVKEHFRRLRADFFAYAHQVFKRLLRVVIVCLLAFVSFLFFGELFDCHKVHGAKVRNLLLRNRKFFLQFSARCGNRIHVLFVFHKVARVVVLEVLL